MKNKKDIKTAVEGVNRSILGTYEGECADAAITNKNGLDITQEVWENVFASDDYKQAIELGWYIGFLGHPEDPNCMDFKNGCIVMTEGHIEPNGKVYGKFNLIDTPVGQIVKAFQDAGVKFGISVRGAGDIIDNSVDPDTFVFRGFDLVSFPAFPESIPTFRDIAASSDIETQAKYKAVCASVNKNIDKIDDINALNMIQSQFAKQSKEYKSVEDRKSKLMSDSDEDIATIKTSVDVQRLDGVTRLYLECVEECEQLKADNEKLNKQLKRNEITASRKLNSVKRITSEQLKDIEHKQTRISKSNAVLIAANRRLKSELETVNEQNLKYTHKVSISASTIKEKDRIIAGLRSQLNETVNEAKDSKARSSDLDDKIKKLTSDLVVAKQLLSDYQKAYATIYANAVGADLNDINISATTTVKELQTILGGTSINHSNADESDYDDYEELDIIDNMGSDDDLITI